MESLLCLLRFHYFESIIYQQQIANYKYTEMDRRLWTEEEDLLIGKLVQKYGTKKWPLISQKLCSEGEFERTGKQCRERWYNHLNPNINNQKWTEEDEQTLFQAHRQHGNKWKNISKLFIGRTDNAIKNHFYSTIRRSLRRINKLQGQKNSTIKMRSIKPRVLSKILQDIDLTEFIFKLGKCKPNKSTKLAYENSISAEKYNEMFEKLMAINSQYQKRKIEKHFDTKEKLYQKRVESCGQFNKQDLKKTERLIERFMAKSHKETTTQMKKFIVKYPKESTQLKKQTKRRIKRKIIQKKKKNVATTSVEQIIHDNQKRIFSSMRSKPTINYVQLHEGSLTTKPPALKSKGFSLFNDYTSKSPIKTQIKEDRVRFEDNFEQFQYERISQELPDEQTNKDLYKQPILINTKSIFCTQNEAINCQIKHPSPAYGKRFQFDDLVIVGHQMKISSQGSLNEFDQNRKISQDQYIQQVLEINFDPNQALKHPEEELQE